MLTMLLGIKMGRSLGKIVLTPLRIADRVLFLKCWGQQLYTKAFGAFYQFGTFLVKCEKVYLFVAKSRYQLDFNCL